MHDTGGKLRIVMPIAQDDLFQGLLSTFWIPKEDLMKFRKAFDDGSTYDFKEQSGVAGHTTIRLSKVDWYRIY